MMFFPTEACKGGRKQTFKVRSEDRPAIAARSSKVGFLMSHDSQATDEGVVYRASRIIESKLSSLPATVIEI